MNLDPCTIQDEQDLRSVLNDDVMESTKIVIKDQEEGVISHSSWSNLGISTFLLHTLSLAS